MFDCKAWSCKVENCKPADWLQMEWTGLRYWTIHNICILPFPLPPESILSFAKPLICDVFNFNNEATCTYVNHYYLFTWLWILFPYKFGEESVGNILLALPDVFLVTRFFNSSTGVTNTHFLQRYHFVHFVWFQCTLHFSFNWIWCGLFISLSWIFACILLCTVKGWNDIQATGCL